MALEVIAEPKELSLVQDDMKLHLETDKFQTVIGTKSVIEIEFNNLPAVDDDIIITLNDGTVATMTCKAVPDDSGTQFTEPGSPSPSVNTYVATIIEDFRSNYDLNSRFVITKDAVFPILILTARESGVKYNATSITTGSSGIFTFSQTDGVDSVYNENFEVGLDIYVEDGYRTGNYTKLPTVFAKPEPEPTDEIEKPVYFNLSERVRRYLSFFDPAVLEEVAVLKVLENVNTRYYYEFFEFYGNTPVAKKVTKSNVLYALQGALSFIDYTEIADWFENWYEDFTVLPLTKFLTWLPANRYVPKKQPCWISWLKSHDTVAHSNENLYLRVKITYTDATTHLFDAATDSAASQFETLCFKVGYEQLGLEAINPAKIVKKWEIWIEHETPSRQQITKSVTFHLIPDHALQRFIVYPNSFGCPETIRIIGRQTVSLDIKRQSFWKHVGMNYNRFARQRKSSFKSYSKTFSGSTGTIKDRTQLDQVVELLATENWFMYDAEKERYIPIEIFNEQVEFEKDDDYIYGVSLEWAEAFENKKFSAVP